MMSDERRYEIIVVTAESWAEAERLVDTSKVHDFHVPDRLGITTPKIEGVHLDFYHATLNLLVSSPDFVPVAAGYRIPFFNAIVEAGEVIRQKHNGISWIDIKAECVNHQYHVKHGTETQETKPVIPETWRDRGPLL
jgi:hypothetical protein